MTPPASTSPRPRSVSVAFWLLVIGAAVLAVGGLLSAMLDFDTVRRMAEDTVDDQTIRDRLTLYRGAGVLCVLAAGALAFLAVRTRSGDPRFRRATLALSVLIVVLVVVLALFVGTHLLAVVALVPILGGALALVRPAASHWFDEQPGELEPGADG